MKKLFFAIFLSTFAFPTFAKTTVDCSEAYRKPATCEVVECNAKYKTFIGEWNGPFSSYVRELSTETQNVFRPFLNKVTYSADDCLKNIDNGDTFIIGRRADSYPGFQGLPAIEKKGLLITGRKKDNSPFLRTIDDDGLNDYTLVYQNSAANLSIWELTIPASTDSPEMRFTTIDGQDFTDGTVHKRNVTVTMSIGPKENPFWESVIAKGYHSLTVN